MPRPKRAPDAPAPARGRPPKNAPPKPVTGVRLTAELVARLDAIVERRNAVLAPQGASTSRVQIISLGLTEWCDAEERRLAQ